MGLIRGLSTSRLLLLAAAGLAVLLYAIKDGRGPRSVWAQQDQYTYSPITTEAQSKIVRLQVLKRDLRQRFDDSGGAFARSMNFAKLDRVIECLTHDSCGPHEAEIIVLSSAHFGNAYFGFAHGETIWALSIDQALMEMNYTTIYTYGHTDSLTVWEAVPDMVPRMFMEASTVEMCTKYDKQHLDELSTVDYEYWQRYRVGCIKREGFEEGIPIHRIHSFHGWANYAHPFGGAFTIAIEDFKRMGISQNHYIGYSIEDRCMAISIPESKSHQAIILGKDPAYFEKPLMAFPDMLDPVQKSMPVDAKTQEAFQFVAVAGAGGQALEEPGLENLGMMPMVDWYQVVAKSKLMLGIGNPPQSPSPYDALCLGTPFINVVKEWDRGNPEDKSKWEYQQPALQWLEPPYVYTVKAGDHAGLEKAVESALKTPVDRFIPPAMKKEALQERLRDLLETDWEARAAEIRRDHDGDDLGFYQF